METMLLSDVFLQKYHGIKSHRDHFLISHDENLLLDKLQSASSSRISVDQTLAKFKLESTRDWDAYEAIRVFKKEGLDEKKSKHYCYRPFFKSYIYNDSNLIEFERPPMHSDLAIKNNRLLLSGRSGQVISGQWDLVFATNNLVDENFFYRGGTYCFPVLVSRNNDLLNEIESNINPVFTEKLKEKTGLKYLKEIDVYFYILALLNHKEYLKKYEHQLKVDFPPIPIPTKNEFLLYWEYGAILDEIFLRGVPFKEHLLKISVVGKDRKISFLKFRNGRVYINKSTFISGLVGEHLNLSHGGYPLIEKFFKDLKKAGLEFSNDKAKNLASALNAKIILEEVRLDIVEDFSILRSSNTTIKPLRDKLEKRINQNELAIMKKAN